jgi:hypothetical protein
VSKASASEARRLSFSSGVLLIRLDAEFAFYPAKTSTKAAIFRLFTMLNAFLTALPLMGEIMEKKGGNNLARARQVQSRLAVRQFGVVVAFQDALIGHT